MSDGNYREARGELGLIIVDCQGLHYEGSKCN